MAEMYSNLSRLLRLPAKGTGDTQAPLAKQQQAGKLAVQPKRNRCKLPLLADGQGKAL